MFISGGRLARYSRKNFTGQRGPAVAYIFGLKLLSGTNWFSPVRVLLPRSVDHSTYSFPWGPSSLLILKSPNFTRWCSSRARQPKNMVLLNQMVRRRLWGMVSQLFYCPQLLNFIFSQSSGFVWLLTFASTTELLSFGR